MEKTFHSAATLDLEELQVPAGATVSQLQQLFRTHDRSVHPLPALSPLVSVFLFTFVHMKYTVFVFQDWPDLSLSSVLELLS